MVRRVVSNDVDSRETFFGTAMGERRVLTPLSFLNGYCGRSGLFVAESVLIGGLMEEMLSKKNATPCRCPQSSLVRWRNSAKCRRKARPPLRRGHILLLWRRRAARRHPLELSVKSSSKVDCIFSCLVRCLLQKHATRPIHPVAAELHCMCGPHTPLLA